MLNEIVAAVSTLFCDAKFCRAKNPRLFFSCTNATALRFSPSILSAEEHSHPQ